MVADFPGMARSSPGKPPDPGWTDLGIYGKFPAHVRSPITRRPSRGTAVPRAIHDVEAPGNPSGPARVAMDKVHFVWQIGTRQCVELNGLGCSWARVSWRRRVA